MPHFLTVSAGEYLSFAHDLKLACKYKSVNNIRLFLRKKM